MSFSSVVKSVDMSERLHQAGREGATCGPAYNRGRALCAAPQLHKYPPNGLLTTELFKHDVDFGPIIIEPDPYESDDYLDDSPPDYFPILLTTTNKIETMNTGEDEPSSGLNGRLRPRKSAIPSIQSKASRKSDGKSALDRAKRTASPAKASPIKPDDLSLDKPEIIPAQQQLLCPYCDRKFAYKQTVSKHARRVHFSASKQESFICCLYCNHNETEPNEIIRHMVDSHPNQYFACLDCNTRFSSTSELAEHKLNVCEKHKPSYRSKLRQKSSTGPRKNQKKLNVDRKDAYRNNDLKDYPSRHGFNGVVISCELKPAQVHDEADIEDNITTNLILPPSKNIGNSNVLEKNAVIVLDDIQWNKRMPPNFTFHNTDADQILSRLGVVHRSPRTGESTRRDWFKSIDESTQKFEKCFDTSFYSKVASNVQENLAKFLDGSFNFNPDPDNTIKTRKSKNSVVINTAEGFPILLAYEQYSRNVFDGYMPRAIAPKHKWKWDNLDNDKNIMIPDQIKRDSHANDCIITLVSSLDIWTQLCMKRKFEEKYSCLPIQKKTEKQNIIGKELKEILESREIPTSSLQLVKHMKPTPPSNSLDFFTLLGLEPAIPQYEMKLAVLSGEWVRPRCYVCCACGAQARDSRALSSHISAQHPNAQVQHYEIAGEMLLNADIQKHLYVPPSQVSNRTRPLRGFRECTKCKKSVTLEELHQHMLDCAGDTPTVRRKCRYRPFGVRRRRPRLPDNTIRKKIRKDLRTRQRQKGHMRSRPRIRTEVGDAETIRKMIADLPAKRHRVMVNPINSNLRPRKKLDKQRPSLIRKQRAPNDQRIRRSRIKDTNKSINNKETAPKLDQDKDYANNDKDDEDNLPLKPRIKRIHGKTSRQSEAFKRKTMLNRAKRKPQNQNIKKAHDLNMLGQASNEQMNLSRDHAPQRVDVNGGPVNAREHAGRGGPTNRGDQPGDGRHENNANNAHVPAQNAPLKHSIARLTADSETHDKSVQFHHLFLVQQECNNVTQHVPTGRPQVFENEATVTRPDKPPLPYEKPQFDPVALQKNKLNKPRKGLNDCIAMLKNKLVDPIPPSTGQVSVQCGSDEPLDMEPIMIAPRVIPPEPHINLRPAEIYSRHCLPIPEKAIAIKPIRSSRNRSATAQRSTSLSIDAPQNERIRVSPKKPLLTLEVIQSKQKPLTTPVKRKSSRLRSASYANHEHNIHTQLTSLSPRIDATHASHMAQALHLLQLPPALQLTQVGQMSKGFTEMSLTPFNMSYMPRNANETSNTKTTRTRSRRDSNKKTETKQRSIEINVVSQPVVKKSVLPEFRSPSQVEIESEYTLNKIKPAEKRSPEIYIQTNQAKQKTHNSYSNDNVHMQNPQPIVPKHINKRVSVDICGESNFSDIPAGITPAHSSTTNIDFVTTAPLDLSGKFVPLDCPKAHSKLETTMSYAMYPYDNYETLDLSNKKTTNDVSSDRETDCDVIVDLRIKTSEPAPFSSQARSLDICTKQTTVIHNDVTDFSIRPREEECIPTDLSMKRNSHIDFRQHPTDTLNNDVQDLSGHKMFTIDEYKTCSRPKEIEQIKLTDVPTDLSGKNTQILSPLVSSHTTECVTDNATKNAVHLTLKDGTEDPLADLSGKTSHITAETSTDVQIVPIKDSLEQSKTVEFTKCDDTINLHYNQSLVSSPSLISKPVYDPTLKIPQYKIQTTASSAETLTSVLNVNSGVVPNLPNSATQNHYVETLTREKSSYGFLDSSLNVNTITGSIPIYTFSKPTISMPVNRFESTKAVYTLANACISVTKIDTSNASTLTNTLLSIPGTTITSTTSVYTLAGTTVRQPMNYGAIPNVVIPPIGHSTINLVNPLLEPSMRQLSRFYGQNSSSIIDKDIENPEILDNVPINIEQDPETAKKIAMLPKELVEILGTMPVGHRNQLLNVLPQYVSTSAGGSCSTSHDKITVQCVTSIDTSTPCEKSKFYPSVNVNRASDATENQKTLFIKMPSVSAVINDPTTNPLFTSAEPLEDDTKHSISLSLNSSSMNQKNNQLHTSPEDVKSLTNNNTSEDVYRSGIINNTVKDLDSDKQPSDASEAPKNTLNIIPEPTIIDLTEEESPDLCPTYINLSKEVPQPVVQVLREDHAVEVVKQNSGNKKTASLRAVRIKAPSERNKSNVIDIEMQPKNTIELPSKLSVSDQDKNVANTSSDSDMSSTIQQTEISSPQHNDKNTAIDRKSSASISPVDQINIEELSGGKATETLPSVSEMAVKIDKKSSTGIQTFVKPTLPVHLDCEEHDMPVNIKEVEAELTEVTVNIPPKSYNVVNNTMISVNDNAEDNCLGEPPKQSSMRNQHLTSEIKLITELSRNEDDDSEDDVSLAIIVKQKKLDQHKCVISEETLQSQNNESMKKKEKKIKKPNKCTIKSDDSLIRSMELPIIDKAENNESILDNTKGLLDNVNNCDSKIIEHDVELHANGSENISAKPVAVEDNQIKKKIKKSHNINFPEKLCDLSKMPCSTGSFEMDINKGKDTSSHCTTEMLACKKNTACEEMTTIATVMITDTKHPSDKLENKCESKEINEDHKQHISLEKLCTSLQDKQLAITKETESLDVVEKAANKMRIGGDNTFKELLTCSHSNEVDDDGALHGLRTVSTDREKPQKKDVLNKAALSCQENTTKKDEPLLGSVESMLNGAPKLEISKNNYSSYSGKLQESENPKSTIESNTKASIGQEEKQLVLPLRRSRRGKSLFIENVSNENVPEVSTEQKAPLTKKQLIFSKLLLDEENQSDIQTNLPIKKVSREENYSCDPGNNSILDSGHPENDTDTLSNTNESRKPVKRKNSPEIKRKNKKKKSMDSTVLEEDTDNSLSVDNMASIKDEAQSKQPEENHDKSPIALERATEGNLIAPFNELDVETHKTSVTNNSVENEDNTNNCNTLSTTTEKRKLNLPTVTADIGHLPKIKKTKLNKNDKLTKSESIQKEHKIIEDCSFAEKDKCHGNTETRTACYNRPAARRTRSKSAFIKQSINDFYDPYDIDLDEMIEKSEPFSKKIEKKVIGKSIVNLSDSDKLLINKNSKEEIRDAEIRKSAKKENYSLIENNLGAGPARDDINHISDSDDSSKSDVPLKKYFEEKEKKLQEQGEHLVPLRETEDDFDMDQSEVDDDKQNEKEDRKSRRTLAVFNNVETVATSTTETEEQLRSEQFMESFGFFSERKPRKSNLLASKKISETFHVIANESEDMYYGVKDRPVKKSLQNENRKSIEEESSSIKAPQHSSLKKASKRGRKKKSNTKIVPCYCGICKKEFKRSDNYLRHQMSLLHISKLSEIEMKVKTAPVHEEPNYLIVYKQHLDRLKILTDKVAKCKKNSKSTSNIILPTMEEIVAAVNKTVREQQLSQRGLSRDEALFLDCCELLKESHKNDLANTEAKLATDLNTYACGTQATISELGLITNRLNEDSIKNDGDVDSITAKNILESEEVRNLENDLISGLKEAANASIAKNITFPRSIDDIVDPPQKLPQNFSNTDIHIDRFSEINQSLGQSNEAAIRKPKKHTEVKEKMYPDIIDSIDMFEDKFDKIKRKCRSQAAAAKQAQTVIETTSSYKGRKKSEKKKGKKSTKKIHQSTQVLTKGALKGFDGIKVSIPTSDINMSAIVPTLETSSKKKRKTSSKKKREKKESESSGKIDSDHRAKDSSTPQRKVDVYEFMDNEDAELFEFRPSTLMERFKSMSNKDTPSTSKFNPTLEDADMSSDSISDGDDFVYMSDDYVCSDDETENSLMSCELSGGKTSNEVKKTTSPLKRKDSFEKNAVMGKIFKHNAVRSEKKNSKGKETVKPKANLDQLFDSLLEDEPSSSFLNSDVTPPRNDDMMTSNKHSPSNYNSPTHSRQNMKSQNKDVYSSSRTRGTLHGKDREVSSDKSNFTPTKKYDEHVFDSGTSNSKGYEDDSDIDYGPSTSKKHDIILTKKQKSPKKHDITGSKKYDCTSSKTSKSPKCKDILLTEDDDELTKKYEAKSSMKSSEYTSTIYDEAREQFEPCFYDEAGVARQRARRKCTVGKQNVLAETWSSESEPDGVPPRPNSAESVVMGGGRRRKGKKKEGSHSGTRRGSSRHVIFRKQDVESRVNSSSRNVWRGGRRSSSCSRESEVEGEEDESLDAEPRSPSPDSMPAPSTSGSKPRPRTSAYCWSSEGDEEQEHLQQHGWIVGDSHKKLVTMLAHAKGRKRNNDDKRHLVE
ncbi:hypothetical protein K1T71_000109 [Dendrolimus kikuchii]|uniref:Uncharacterized protein n=1 Tax=Dendrolimus kikuchii TaxID=765133 RepID=A0ACC1DIH1_9NEOP|nr:hypothetical protein K1T71_000109 [Dendrolimus kikuchii]